MKRTLAEDNHDVNMESYKKKQHIKNQALDATSNYKYNNNPVKINHLDIELDVKTHKVKISNLFGEAKYNCTCSTDVYLKYENNHCKHISMALTELIKKYLIDTEEFFNEKKKFNESKKNIDFLKTSIKNINI